MNSAEIIKNINSNPRYGALLEEFNLDRDRMPIQPKLNKPSCYQIFASRIDQNKKLRLPNSFTGLRYTPADHQDLPDFALTGGGQPLDRIIWEMNWVLYLIDQQRYPDNFFDLKNKLKLQNNTIFDHLVVNKITEYFPLEYLSYHEYCQQIVNYGVLDLFGRYVTDKIGQYFNLEIPIYFGSSSKLLSPGSCEFHDGRRIDYPYHQFMIKTIGRGIIRCDEHIFDDKCSCNLLHLTENHNGYLTSESRVYRLEDRWGPESFMNGYLKNFRLHLNYNLYSTGFFIHYCNLKCEKIILIFDGMPVLERNWDDLFVFDNWLFFKFDDRSLLDNILYPYQSGQKINFNRIDNPVIELVNISSNQQEVITIRTYQYNLNVIRQMSGMIGLAFSS